MVLILTLTMRTYGQATGRSPPPAARVRATPYAIVNGPIGALETSTSSGSAASPATARGPARPPRPQNAGPPRPRQLEAPPPRHPTNMSGVGAPLPARTGDDQSVVESGNFHAIAVPREAGGLIPAQSPISGSHNTNGASGGADALPDGTYVQQNVQNNVHLHQLQQQLNLAVINADPALVQEAMAAISHYQAQAEQIRVEAVRYSDQVRAEAEVHRQQVELEAVNYVHRAEVEATERARQIVEHAQATSEQQVQKANQVALQAQAVATQQVQQTAIGMSQQQQQQADQHQRALQRLQAELARSQADAAGASSVATQVQRAHERQLEQAERDRGEVEALRNELARLRQERGDTAAARGEPMYFTLSPPPSPPPAPVRSTTPDTVFHETALDRSVPHMSVSDPSAARPSTPLRHPWPQPPYQAQPSAFCSGNPWGIGAGIAQPAPWPLPQPVPRQAPYSEVGDQQQQHAPAFCRACAAVVVGPFCSACGTAQDARLHTQGGLLFDQPPQYQRQPASPTPQRPANVFRETQASPVFTGGDLPEEIFNVDGRGGDEFEDAGPGDTGGGGDDYDGESSDPEDDGWEGYPGRGSPSPDKHGDDYDAPGGGGGGGDGDEPPPARANFEDDLGPANRPEIPHDLGWSVTSEDTVYSRRDLQNFTVAPLPNNATEFESWANGLSVDLGALDKSSAGYLTRWIQLPLNPRGDSKDVVNQFHTNSQGLYLLDRFLGARLCTQTCQEHAKFGLQFRTYIRHCRDHGISPQGRAMISMIALRFRLDRARGNTVTSMVLVNLQLASFKASDVRVFVEKTRLCFAALPQNEMPTQSFLYHWIHEKFRRCPWLATKMERIQDSPPNSRRRTFAYIWHAVSNHLVNMHEDENMLNVSTAIAGGRAGAAVARTRKGRAADADATGTPATPAPVDTGNPGKGGKGKGKGKGKSDTGKGKDDKGSGKGDRKTQATKEEEARTAARNKKPHERTQADKKLLACKFFLRGACTSDACEYSHSKRICDAELGRQKAAPLAAAATGSQPSGKPQAQAQPQPKAEPKTKSKKPAAAATVPVTVASALGAATQLTGADGLKVVQTTTPVFHRLVSKFLPVFAAVNGVLPKLRGSDTNLAKLSMPTAVPVAPERLPMVTTPTAVHVAPGQDVVPCVTTKPQGMTSPANYWLEYINDSGAGRNIASSQSLQQQGIPLQAIRGATGKASATVKFDTAGGIKQSDRSLGITTSAGSSEVYLMEESPVAFSMGDSVINRNQPFIWIHPDLPYHVTDASKLTVKCPRRYKHYADRIEEGVPIWREQVTVQSTTSSRAAANIFHAAPALEEAAASGDPEAPRAPSPDVAPEPAIVIPDVPLHDEDSPGDDPTVRYRSMSRQALMAEANTPRHRASHFPHNPYCDTCSRAHLRQRRYDHKGHPEDDQLDPPTAPNEAYSSDSLVISRSHDDETRISSSGNSTVHTIRDMFSGMLYGVPLRARTKDNMFKNFKFFSGPFASRPHILVKSDAAQEITLAVEDMGWLSEQSLENRWPHNAAHERSHGTVKSCIRAAMVQSGFPEPAWDLAVEFACVALSATMPAPIAPYEKDAGGKVLDKFQGKLKQTAWQCHHKGEPFAGPLQPFGRLIYYRNSKPHPLMPTTAAGIFAGWRIEHGLRYRGVIKVLDYEHARQHGINRTHVVSVPEKEIWYPPELVFPYANARKLAIEHMRPLAAPDDAVDDVPDDFAQAPSTEVFAPPEPVGRRNRFQITEERIAEYGPTEGCSACEVGGRNHRHSAECRARFRSLLKDDGKLDFPDAAGPHSADPPETTRDETAAAPPTPLQIPLDEDVDIFRSDGEDEAVTAPIDVEDTLTGRAVAHDAPLRHGLAAAITAADTVIDATRNVLSDTTVEALVSFAADTIRRNQQVGGSSSSSSPCAPAVRSSDKLPGHGHVLQIGTPPQVLLEDQAKCYDAVRSTCTFTPSDLDDAEWQRKALDYAETHPGCLLIGDLPSTAWSRDKWSQAHNYGPAAMDRLAQRRASSLSTINAFIVLADTVLASGGHVVFRWPDNVTGWLRPEILTFIQQHNLYTFNITHDLKNNHNTKQLRYITDEKRLAINSQTFDPPRGRCAKRDPPGRTMQAMNHTILSTFYGYEGTCPAMPTIPATAATAHRPHEQVPFKPTWELFCMEHGISSDGAVLSNSNSNSYGLVTRLMDRKEWYHKPSAIQAVRKEGQALVKAGTWDEQSVIEKDDLIQKSRESGKKIVVGDLMTICSMKFSELPEDQQVPKGRIVYRGDSAKDEVGAPAIYQELAATPTNIPDINANIAFGLLPGNETSVADAVKAYVQAELKSQHPTWVTVPRELQPEAWRSKHFRRPCCRLLRALYGHPEAGAHWQAHFDKILRERFGATPIEGHLSSYMIPQYGLYLTVYVDDLLLSGPKGQHSPFWEELGKFVQIEAPEGLGRFLGRLHTFFEGPAGERCVSFDMGDYTKQAVQMYRDVVGIQTFKVTTTPFCPDGSLTLEGECTRGELSPKACGILMKCLWLARLARPDVLKAINDLSTHLSQWSSNDDRRLLRLISYLHTTQDDRLVGSICDTAEDLYVELFCDADFSGADDNARSTSGGFMVLRGPRGTFFPLGALAKRQTATSRSTTEAEVISVAHNLFGDGLPALSLWETLLGRKVRLLIREDNQATIRVMIKGFSPKLRHISRTHRVDISSIKEVLDSDSVEVVYTDTNEQAADLFTKALPPHKWPAAMKMIGLWHGGDKLLPRP